LRVLAAAIETTGIDILNENNVGKDNANKFTSLLPILLVPLRASSPSVRHAALLCVSVGMKAKKSSSGTSPATTRGGHHLLLSALYDRREEIATDAVALDTAVKDI
jgi:hypothetical protein